MTREEYELRKAAERHRAFLLACEPVHRMVAKAVALSTPTITIYPDGRVEHVWGEQVSQAIQCGQQMIDQIAKSMNIIDTTGAKP